jgi:hypothetical protein
MEMHPLTLLTLAYAGDSPHKADELLAQVRGSWKAVKERDAAKPAARDVVMCCEQQQAPRRWAGRCGCHAAWGLLRDQIRSCVPSSPSIRRA